MRILQINTVCGYGSTGRITIDLYNELVKNGHKACIAYGRGRAPDGYNTIKIGNDIDVYYHAFMNRITDKHGRYSTKPTQELVEKIAQYNPDIIHLHNIHGYYLNIEILFAYLKTAAKPVVWTLHDCWAFTGHCVHFTYAGCDKWRKGCYECKQKATYPATKFLDSSKENYLIKKKLFTSVENMMIVTPSKWLAELVKQSFLNKYPVRVINNGIDTNLFRARVSSLREKYNLQNKFIILGVANGWSERKGLKDFIELAEIIDDSKQSIILVGLSEEQLISLPNNIIGIKRTNSIQELAELYSIADVFFNPTYEDNYPTVNLEAIACGTPVVTYGIGGSGECINELTGLIIDQHDKQIFTVNNVRVLNKLICNKEYEKFDKKHMFEKYLSVYKNSYKH